MITLLCKYLYLNSTKNMYINTYVFMYVSINVFILIFFCDHDNDSNTKGKNETNAIIDWLHKLLSSSCVHAYYTFTDAHHEHQQTLRCQPNTSCFDSMVQLLWALEWMLAIKSCSVWVVCIEFF